MADLHRIRYVAQHYTRLQGLRLVPLGVPFLLSATWRAGWFRGVGTAGGRGPSYVLLASLAVAIALSFPIGASYRRRFGVVRAWPERSGAVSLTFTCLAFALLVWLQDAFNWAVSIPMVFVGGVLVLVGVVQEPRRKHYVAIGIACLIFATLGSVGVSVHVRDVVFDLLIGAGLIAVGVGDHLILRETLQPSSAEPYARTV